MSEENNAPEQTNEDQVTGSEEVVESTESATPDLSAQFVEIQKREKAIRAKQNKLNQQLEAEKAKWVDELKNAPLEKLSEYGVKADTLASSFLNSEPVKEPTSEDLMRQELESLKEWKSSQEQQYNNRVLTDYQNEVMSTVENDPDGEFELINNHKDGKNLYWETVTAYYQEHGEAPDYKQLAQTVEAHLESEAKQLLGLKKFARKEEVEEKIAAKNEVAEKKPSITIGSSMTGRSAPKVTMVTDARKYDIGNEFSRLKQERENTLADKLAAALAKNNN